MSTLFYYVLALSLAQRPVRYIEPTSTRPDVLRDSFHHYWDQPCLATRALSLLLYIIGIIAAPPPRQNHRQTLIFPEALGGCQIQTDS